MVCLSDYLYQSLSVPIPQLGNKAWTTYCQNIFHPNLENFTTGHDTPTLRPGVHRSFLASYWHRQRNFRLTKSSCQVAMENYFWLMNARQYTMRAIHLPNSISYVNIHRYSIQTQLGRPESPEAFSKKIKDELLIFIHCQNPLVQTQDTSETFII